MNLQDLDFNFPPELVATEPVRASRVALVPQAEPREINMGSLLNEFRSGDVLVINDTRVIPARVFSNEEIEVLFLRAQDPQTWQVLFAARDFAVGDTLLLPQDLRVTLVQKGLPQVVKLSRALSADYFAQFGEVALPPYIQEARGQRHNRAEDRAWYQTQWARQEGSVAAPTASLHFKNHDLEMLRTRGVHIAHVTLHVGAGTFLPVRSQDLAAHQMHEEWASIPAETLQTIANAKARGGRVWALGTTVARTLESHALDMFAVQGDGSLGGSTGLFIYPPFQFRVVDCLLTNFHQPKSTLFALVAAFAGLARARETYAWAIERRFRFFSYGDLSAWTHRP